MAGLSDKHKVDNGPLQVKFTSVCTKFVVNNTFKHIYNTKFQTVSH